ETDFAVAPQAASLRSCQRAEAETGSVRRALHFERAPFQRWRRGIEAWSRLQRVTLVENLDAEVAQEAHAAVQFGAAAHPDVVRGRRPIDEAACRKQAAHTQTDERADGAHRNLLGAPVFFARNRRRRRGAALPSRLNLTRRRLFGRVGID